MFIFLQAEERLQEIKVLLENLEPKEPLMFDTTHATNLVRMEGLLPDERRRLLREIENHIKIYDGEK